MEMMVLLKVDWMWAMPVWIFFLTFFLAERLPTAVEGRCLGVLDVAFVDMAGVPWGGHECWDR